MKLLQNQALVFGLLLLSASLVSAFSPTYVSPVVSMNQRAPTRLYNAVEEAENAYFQMALEGEGVVAKPEVVYVIMYNPGTEEEGIHTMERGDSDVLLAFESIEDVNYFANVLREDPNWQQEPIPTPTQLGQMEIACQQMGLPVKVVPERG